MIDEIEFLPHTIKDLKIATIQIKALHEYSSRISRTSQCG